MLDTGLNMLLDVIFYCFITIKSFLEIFKKEFIKNKVKHPRQNKQKRNRK